MEIGFIAEVPVICYVEDDRLFCNAANGFVLYARRGNELRELERSPGPNIKQLDYKLEEGEVYYILPKP